MKYIITAIILSLSLMIIGCNGDEQSKEYADLLKPEKYETVVSYEDNILGLPSILKYSHSHLYIYDSQQKRVIKTDERGNIVNEYGRYGRGPGEFLGVSDIFISNGNVYLVDINQFLIHEYHQNGNFLSSINFTPPTNRLPPPPPIPPIQQGLKEFLTFAYQYNFNNQTHVTDGGDLLIQTAYADSATSLYNLIDRQGDELASLGQIPENSQISVDFSEYRRSISDRQVPSVSKRSTFLVKDKANPDEYFLVYSAIPKIAKYKLSGEKMWEAAIPENPEIESIEQIFYETADHALGITDIRIPMRKYYSGVSDNNGELFLATYRFEDYEKSLIIHRFSNTGKLVSRYKLGSEAKLLPVFDIDQSSANIYISTDEAEIRIYDLSMRKN